MKILGKLIIKILKKYPSLKNEIFEELKEEKAVEEKDTVIENIPKPITENNDIKITSFDLEKIITDINNILNYKKVDEEINEKQDEVKAFDSINPRAIIIAETPDYVGDDLSHLIRPFLVVGKDSKYLYAIKETTVDKYDNNKKYYKYYNPVRDIYSYLKCDEIFKINKDQFKKVAYYMDFNEYKEVLEKIITHCDNFEKVDFKSFKYSLRRGSIIIKNNESYVLMDDEKNTDEHKIAKLVKDENSEIYINYKGSKHVVDVDNIFKLKASDKDYTIIGDVPSKFVGRIRNTDISDYEIGDVLSLKNSKEKIIYLTQIDKMIYYVNFDQLDFFTGISKIEKDRICGHYRKLNSGEIKRLISKIEKPLSNDNSVVYYAAKDNILNSISKIKEM